MLYVACTTLLSCVLRCYCYCCCGCSCLLWCLLSWSISISISISLFLFLFLFLSIVLWFALLASTICVDSIPEPNEQTNETDTGTIRKKDDWYSIAGCDGDCDCDCDQPLSSSLIVRVIVIVIVTHRISHNEWMNGDVPVRYRTVYHPPVFCTQLSRIYPLWWWWWWWWKRKGEE